MRRGNLFFIGLLSAIITIVSLNFALGRPGYFHERYPFYHRYHRCYDRYDNRYDDRYRNDQHQQRNDSTNSNH